jgi:hypothetical protein
MLLDRSVARLSTTAAGDPAIRGTAERRHTHVVPRLLDCERLWLAARALAPSRGLAIACDGVELCCGMKRYSIASTLP